MRSLMILLMVLAPVAHAGEEGPPAYVWEALDGLKIDRLDPDDDGFVGAGSGSADAVGERDLAQLGGVAGVVVVGQCERVAQQAVETYP